MLARRAPGVLRFLRIPFRWQTSSGPPPPSADNDDTSFLTAEDFQKEGDLAAATPLSSEEKLLNPKTPPDLTWNQYRRLKAIDFSDRDKLQASRRQEKHDEWQAELDLMRKATETGFSTSAQDLNKIKSHTLQNTVGPSTADVKLDSMNATTTEGLAAELSGEMEKVDVPMQDYFNATLFPEALDAGKWLPKRVKGKCIFCMSDPTPKHVKDIQFTNVQLLHAFINERGMITSRRWNYNCRKHQKKLAKAVRRARVLGFLSPTDNFFAPEAFANTNLEDLAKLTNSTDLGLYGIGGGSQPGNRRHDTRTSTIDPNLMSDSTNPPPSTAWEEKLRNRPKKNLADVIE